MKNKKIEEIALQISNDISEDINNYQSEKQYRIAVKYFADKLCEKEIEILKLKNIIFEYKIKELEKLIKNE